MVSRFTLFEDHVSGFEPYDGCALDEGSEVLLVHTPKQWVFFQNSL
jgi:hypothetical protein